MADKTHESSSDLFDDIMNEDTQLGPPWTDAEELFQMKNLVPNDGAVEADVDEDLDIINGYLTTAEEGFVDEFIKEYCSNEVKLEENDRRGLEISSSGYFSHSGGPGVEELDRTGGSGYIKTEDYPGGSEHSSNEVKQEEGYFSHSGGPGVEELDRTGGPGYIKTEDYPGGSEHSLGLGDIGGGDNIIEFINENGQFDDISELEPGELDSAESQSNLSPFPNAWRDDGYGFQPDFNIGSYSQNYNLLDFNSCAAQYNAGAYVEPEDQEIKKEIKKEEDIPIIGKKRGPKPGALNAGRPPKWKKKSMKKSKALRKLSQVNGQDSRRGGRGRGSNTSRGFEVHDYNHHLQGEEIQEGRGSGHSGVDAGHSRSSRNDGINRVGGDGGKGDVRGGAGRGTDGGKGGVGGGQGVAGGIGGGAGRGAGRVTDGSNGAIRGGVGRGDGRTADGRNGAGHSTHGGNGGGVGRGDRRTTDGRNGAGRSTHGGNGGGVGRSTDNGNGGGVGRGDGRTIDGRNGAGRSTHGGNGGGVGRGRGIGHSVIGRVDTEDNSDAVEGNGAGCGPERVTRRNARRGTDGHQDSGSHGNTDRRRFVRTEVKYSVPYVNLGQDLVPVQIENPEFTYNCLESIRDFFALRHGVDSLARIGSGDKIFIVKPIPQVDVESFIAHMNNNTIFKYYKCKCKIFQNNYPTRLPRLILYTDDLIEH